MCWMLHDIHTPWNEFLWLRHIGNLCADEFRETCERFRVSMRNVWLNSPAHAWAKTPTVPLANLGLVIPAVLVGLA